MMIGKHRLNEDFREKVGNEVENCFKYRDVFNSEVVGCSEWRGNKKV